VPFSRYRTLSGEIVPIAGVLDISAENAGIVSQLAVTEGSIVSRGELLVQIRSSTSSAAYGETAQTLVRNMKDNLATINQELRVADGIATAEQSAEIRKRKNLLDQRSKVQAQLKIRIDQATAQEKIMSKITALQRTRVVSEVQAAQQENTTLEAKAQVEGLKQILLQNAADIDQSTDRIKSLPEQATERRASLADRARDIESSLASLEGQRLSVLESPCDCTISAITAHVGSPVQPGQALMSVLPLKSRMIGQALVRTRDAAELTPGQQVSLRIDGYPYQRFGILSGRIESISPTALTSAQSEKLKGVDTGSPVYLVQIGLLQSSPSLKRSPPLSPGSTFRADVLIDRREIYKSMLSFVDGQN
jgi:membrane fusion protein